MRDAFIWHSIHLERYKVGIQRDMVRELNKTRKIISKRLTRLSNAINSGQSRALWTQARLAEELRAIDEILATGYARMNSTLDGSINEIVDFEIEWTAGQMATAGAVATVAMPTSNQVIAAIEAKPFDGWLKDKGVTYAKGSPLRNVPAYHRNKMASLVRSAWISGMSVQDTKKELSILSNLFTASTGTFNEARRNITAEARTALQTHAARAQELVFEANKDLFPWVEYTATLDSRTTEVCGSLDGRTYRVEDTSRPQIPQHWNCRSVYIPKETKNEQLVGDRASAGGPVPSNTSFQDWLRQQDKENPEFVRDYFKTDERYEKWKAGKLGNIRYTSQDGRAYNIRNLKNPPLRQAPKGIVYDQKYLRDIMDKEGVASDFDRVVEDGRDYDPILARMWRERGFDKKPQIVSRAKFDQLKTPYSGFRGIGGDNAKEYIQDFRSGELYHGRGIYGSGTYMAYGDNALDEATFYAAQVEDNVFELKLASDAKVIDRRALVEEIYKLEDEMSEAGATFAEIADFTMDQSRVATYLGYDAIDIPYKNYLVILNRSKVVMPE